MRLSIRYKLFFALSLSTLFTVALMAIVLQHNFRSDFADFRSQQDLEQLNKALPRLISHYQEFGNWQQIVNRPKVLGRLVHPEQSPHRKPRHHTQGGQSTFRPPAHKKRPPPPDKLSSKGLLDRVSVLNAEGLVITPYSKQVDYRIPIVLNQKTIGWLGLERTKGLSNQLEKQFAYSQRKSIYVVSAIALALTIITALLLSKHLLSPIQSLADGMGKLTLGKFDSRLDIQRKDELGQLAHDYNQLALTLEQNEKLRRQWVADTSHELRTPIAILHGEIEAIRDGIRHADDKVLASLHEETQHLSKLINDLNDLSLSDAGALNYQLDTLDLSELIEHVVDEFDTRATQQGIRIQYESSGQALLRGDSTRLQQMLCNLIENSLRYTDAPGDLYIKCNTDAHHITLILEDSSPAPDGQAIPHLFDRFYRAEASRNRKTGGSGLGLAICRNIVEAHQGTIKAYHAPSSGLGISISLPIA